MDTNAAVLFVEPAAFAAGVAALKVPVDVIGRRRRALLLLLAAISAGVAVAAGGAPTGWQPLDVLLLAGLGATAVLAGSRASSGLILAGSIVVALFGAGSVALPLALAAIGLMLASLLVEVEAVIDAAAGGLVAQAALRLTTPGADGLTALVAAVVLVPLVVSAVRTLRPRHRRTLSRIALGLLGFALVAGVLGTIAAFSAAEPLRRGLAVATTAIDATRSANLETTATGLSRAGRDFAEARRTLDSWWARPAGAVPVVAQHWRMLRAAAVTGKELAAAGQRALGAPALGDIRVRDGRVPLDQLAAIEPPVADLAGRAVAARSRLDAADSSWLVPPLSDRLDRHLRQLRSVEETVQLVNRVLPLVPRLLGGDGPRRYFLAVQTPVESRAGGGFLGSYGEITAEDGRLTLSRFGRPEELPMPPGQPDEMLAGLEGRAEFLARYGRFRPTQTWSNVNLSPDFPTDAKVMASLYPRSGGAPVDGVIAVDPAALAAVLSLTGGVEVPSWPDPIGAANALDVLLRDQYENPSRDARIDFLGEVAEGAWRKLTSGDLPPLPQLLAAFGPAVQEKHLFLWSDRPDEQKLFEDMAAAGRLAPVKGDFIGLVTQNATGNKIDYFLRREVDYRVTLDPDTGRLQATARVALHNEAPADGVGLALIGNDLVPPIPRGSNKLYLSFYTPWELLGGRVDGKAIELERATEQGRRVYSTAVQIPSRSTVIVELSLSGSMPEGDDYRLDVYRQPAVAPDDVTAVLTLAPGWRTGAGASEHTAKHQLESDTTVNVSIRPEAFGGLDR